ncbi:Similar to Fas1: Fasciclin-1 (Drosophila melanogaster) [Cotesia congregata]|uniref:Similar to Fas1: Fasciclin-1 (Drosophila melanogaster) n=1 Tax=Cotesia congregata TaxID=51543 RepID=A0A8J2H0F7_COTCN|nr:Similar to Fas1: Fasciclin-1 (Drosophila melanogaster) [Cotesia congregata]
MSLLFLVVEFSQVKKMILESKNLVLGILNRGSTYMLGQRRNFNDRLSEPKKRYTYFVPRNSAWEKAKNIFPSAYKKIFMPDFSYHVSI